MPLTNNNRINDQYGGYTTSSKSGSHTRKEPSSTSSSSSNLNVLVFLGMVIVFVVLVLFHYRSTMTLSQSSTASIRAKDHPIQENKVRRENQHQNNRHSKNLDRLMSLINATRERGNHTLHQYGRLNSDTDSNFRNLVLGLAESTAPESFAIYLGSLREKLPTADVVVFVNAPASPRMIEIVLRTKSVLIEYERGSLHPSFINQYHASSLRWIFYHRYLVEYESVFKERYDKVLFTDVRDVAFQSDPFKRIPNRNTFYGLLEGNDIPIAQCAWNSGWIRDCFNEKILAAIQQNMIVCSGVSLGSLDLGMKYVKMMSEILQGQHELSFNFPSCERNGVDQGIHNVLMHLGFPIGSEIKTQYAFPVAHLQENSMYPDLNIHLKDLLLPIEIGNAFEGNMQTQNSIPSIGVPQFANMNFVPAAPSVITPPAIVHQYDRYHNVALDLAELYVYWKNLSDFRSAWLDDATCVYHTWTGKDFLVGHCDAGQSRAFAPSECCAFCRSRNEQYIALSSDFHAEESVKACTGFAFSAGVCYYKSCGVQDIQKMYESNIPDKNERLAADWSYRGQISLVNKTDTGEPPIFLAFLLG